MALLKRSLPLALALVSCHGASDGGQFEAHRFDRAVRCDESDCVSEGPIAVPVEQPPLTEGFAFLSLELREDLLLYAELPIDGGVGHLEIELRGDDEPLVSYVERVGGEVVFVGETVTGIVEVPEVALDDDCTCETGRLQLRFEDSGMDGLWGTDDDQVRQLDRGRFERGESFCVAPESWELDDELEVRRVDRCPRPSAPSPSPSPPPPSDPYPSSGGSTSCDTSGCDADGASCDGGSSGGGCDSGSSGGCEGDSSASCEGDSSGSCDGGGSDTCTGDAALLPLRAPRGCGSGLGDGRLQLVLFLALIVVDLRRRARGVARAA